MLDADLKVTTFDVDFGVISETGRKITWYDGPYEVTPGDTDQVLDIESKTAKQQITIKAVPKGYGKISWDGVTLGVK